MLAFVSRTLNGNYTWSLVAKSETSACTLPSTDSIIQMTQHGAHAAKSNLAKPHYRRSDVRQ